MHDNDELMRIRGQYVTAEERYRELAGIISGEAKLLTQAIEDHVDFSKAATSHTAKKIDFEECVARLRRLHEAAEEAEEVRATLRRLKPLTGLSR